MPCFEPNKQFLISLTNELVESSGAMGPFLEIGCGDGTFTELLANRGWGGAAIDLSEEAVLSTTKRISAHHPAIEVMLKSVFDLVDEDRYSLAIMYDVLEHIEDDVGAVERICCALKQGGFLLVSFPIKQSEWRWDDDYYGHVRRYEQDRIDQLFNNGPFRIVSQWDTTFPVIFYMRRIYTRFFMQRIDATQSYKTQLSAFNSAANGRGYMKWVYRWIEKAPLWGLVFTLQRSLRNLNKGCNTLILVQKVG